jgi:mono/diheme cytochrome c family protein
MAALLVALSGGAVAQSAPAADTTRGQLLYETHCIACHNSQMHWRDQRLARDWGGLAQQVRHWQGRANLNWSDDDVLEVVRHLNDRIYRYAAPLPPRSAAPAAPAVLAEGAGRSARPVSLSAPARGERSTRTPAS